MPFNRRMDKENVVIYTMEYYAAEKNNDIMKFAGKWMELENVILSEDQSPDSNTCIRQFTTTLTLASRDLTLPLDFHEQARGIRDNDLDKMELQPTRTIPDKKHTLNPKKSEQ
ncbi:hypothetical protein STEG23_030035, partial [Scotinomys teguina]